MFFFFFFWGGGGQVPYLNKVFETKALIRMQEALVLKEQMLLIAQRVIKVDLEKYTIAYAAYLDDAANVYVS